MVGNKHNILWIDCLGGLVVGIVVLLLYKLISSWDGLPVVIVIAMGLANVVYGAYSLYVTTRNQRSVLLVNILAIANMAWLFFCVLIVCLHWEQITLFGIAHVIGEGIYVAGLGITEWIWRSELGQSVTKE